MVNASVVLLHPSIHSVMGAVHGVFLKYAVVSLATGFYGLHYHASLPQTMPNGQPNVFGFHPMVIAMGYMCFTNGTIAALFCLRRCVTLEKRPFETGWACFFVELVAHDFERQS